MKKLKNRRCGECGSRQLENRNQIGKPFPWKDYPAVFLGREFKALECRLCGNLILSARDAAELDRVIVETIIEDTRQFIGTILEREGCRQRQLADHIGISSEYLSEIKSGRKQPGFQTYNFLKTLSVDPRSFAVSNPRYEGFRRKSA